MGMLPNIDVVEISRLVKVFYNAAAGNTYMTAFTDRVDQTSMSDFANWIGDFVSTDSATLASTVAVNLGVTGDALADVTAYLEDQLNADPSNHGQVILDAVNLFSTLEGDATYGTFATDFNNSVATALDYSLDVNNTTIDLATLQAADEGLTELYLTTGQDIMTGTAGDDTFIARGNSSLDNADILDGGDGTDTLEVMLDNTETAESPLLSNIEILKVQAQSNINPSGNNDVDALADVEANIDAGDMPAVEQYWSEDSRSDVVIEDVSHNSHITTVGMRETDPGDVDLAVFFDPENITAPGTGDDGATIEIKAVNVVELAESVAGNPANILANFNTLKFFVGTTSVQVNMEAVTSHAELVTEINDTLAAAGFTDITASIVGTDIVSDSLDNTVIGSYDVIHIVSQVTPMTADGITLDADANITDMNNVMTDDPIAAIPSLTQVDVILDRVGRDDQGGDLIIGSDSVNDDGIQQFNIDVDRNSHLTSISSTANILEVINVENIGANGYLMVDAIQDVRVFDASAMSGAVTLGADLSSNITAKYLDRTDTDVDALTTTDVDTSADNSENAYSTVVDNEFSYDFGSGNDSLNLTIDSANLADAGTATREDFVLAINGNDGDDSITTGIVNSATGTLAGANLATPWYINSQLDGLNVADAVDPQDFASLSSNLTINAGSGNDTVATSGAGSWLVDLGAGDDVIYNDNSGAQAESAVFDNSGRATWVFNTSDQTTAGAAARNIDNLVSDTNEEYSFYRSILTVDFNGYTVDIEIMEYSTTELQLNNYIKAAIQNDVHMNKLVVAEDGPGNTLVIRSLVDGAFDTTDFTVSIAAQDLDSIDLNPLVTSGDVAAYDNDWDGDVNVTTFADKAAIANNTDADIAAWAASNDYATALANDGAVAFTGAASTVATASVIYDGTGNDTIVLSTSNIDTELVKLSGDGEKDVIFNVTNAIIENIDINDIIIASNGTVYTSANADINGTLTITVDVTAPSLATLSPADDATAVAVDSDIAITFDEDVQAGTGNIVLVNDTTGAATVYDVTTSALLDFTGDTVTINPAADLDAGSDYHVIINATAIADTAGNSFAGIAATTAFNFSTAGAAAGTTALTPGSTAPVAATAAADVFSFSMADALALTANTQIVISGFDTAADSLQLDITTAGGVSTLADLNGVDGIAVQSNAITGVTTINFGADADGDIVAIQLAGVTDLSLVAVEAV